MKSVQEWLGDSVRERREARQMSQIQLSELADVSMNTIYLIESKKRWVGPETADKIAKALNLQHSWELFVPKAGRKLPTLAEALQVITEHVNGGLAEVRKLHEMPDLSHVPKRLLDRIARADEHEIVVLEAVMRTRPRADNVKGIRRPSSKQHR